jgi:acetyltransferase-like isoleucine patch superfamily enzyme
MKRIFKNIHAALFGKLTTEKDLSFNPNKNKFLNVEIMSSTLLSGKNEIGEYTYIGFNSLITKSSIGRYCSIANNVSIGIGEHKIDRVSTSSLFYKNAYEILTENECIIGNDVWIGSNAVIRRGVQIGDGAIIGANSFVNKDVKPFEIVGGTPAKFIKMRFNDEKIQLIKKSKWWNKDLESARFSIKELELTGLFEKNDE